MISSRGSSRSGLSLDDVFNKSDTVSGVTALRKLRQEDCHNVKASLSY